MTIHSSRSLVRAIVVASVTLAAASTLLLTASVEPATALCKYGSPNCVNPHRPDPPKVGGETMPGSGWVDTDCKYYGNCNSSEVKGTAAKTKGTTTKGNKGYITVKMENVTVSSARTTPPGDNNKQHLQGSQMKTAGANMRH